MNWVAGATLFLYLSFRFTGLKFNPFFNPILTQGTFKNNATFATVNVWRDYQSVQLTKHRTMVVLIDDRGGVQPLKPLIMDFNIARLAKDCPGLTVSITVEDLISANKLLISDVKKELEHTIAEQHKVTYYTTEYVKNTLNVSDTTLWRWNKSKYLVPINIGGQRRYKSTDINDILEGKK